MICENTSNISPAIVGRNKTIEKINDLAYRATIQRWVSLNQSPKGTCYELINFQ